jgi:hypothetical protein
MKILFNIEKLLYHRSKHYETKPTWCIPYLARPFQCLSNGTKSLTKGLHDLGDLNLTNKTNPSVVSNQNIGLSESEPSSWFF